MNLQNKILIVIYIIIAISFFLGILSIDLHYREIYPAIMNSTKIIGLPQPIEKIHNEKIVDVPLEIIFNTITDVKHYPIILPKNVVSINIINQTESSIIAQEVLVESGVKTTLLVKHEFNPYSSHKIEILDGDAMGTTINQKFTMLENSTVISTEINFKLNGPLLFVKFIPESNLNHALTTVLDSFVTYSKISQSKEKKIIDELYREILLRPSDKEGLDYYSSKLVSGELTVNQIRDLLLNSDERSMLLRHSEIKTIDELKPETKLMINQLYLKILGRNSDLMGIEYYGSLIESEEMTIPQLEKILFNSDEALSMRLSNDNKRQLDSIYYDILGEHMNATQLTYYEKQIRLMNMTLDEFKDIIANP